MFAFCKGRRASLIVVLWLPLVISAQSRTYSLRELINSAARHLPLLKEKEASVNSYKAVITDTRHQFLPTMRINDQVNLGTANSLAGAYLPFGVNPSVSAGVRDQNDWRTATGNLAVLYSEYELADFGLKSARIDNAIAYANVEQADFERILYQTKLEVSRLYFNLLKDQFKLAADSENIRRYQAIYTVIKALSLSGIRPGSDTSLSKAELSKAIINYNQTLGELVTLKQELAYWSGIDAVDLQTDTSALHSFSNYQSPVGLPIDTIHNPLIDFYVKQRTAFLSNETLIRKSYLPKILLAGSTWARGSGIQYDDKYGSFSDGLGYQRFNYMVAIGVTYDLFNSIHKRDRLTIGKFQTQASEFALRQEQLSLSNASLQADNALQTAINNLRELPVQLQSAKDVYEQKMAQYKAGLITLIDLTNASFVLYRSQTDYIETMSDWYLASLDKAAAIGNLDSFIQSIK